jgi:hypothetical protein
MVKLEKEIWDVKQQIYSKAPALAINQKKGDRS